MSAAPATSGHCHSRGHWSLITAHCSLALLLLAPAIGRAHQVPRSEYDRNVTIKVRTDGVIIVYRVELDEYTLLTTVGNPANGFPLKPDGKIGRKDIAEAFIARMKEASADQLIGSHDGQTVVSTCTATRPAFPHPARPESEQFF